MTASLDKGLTSEGLDFIRAIVEADLRSGKCDRVIVRFPPEPNGYPHIGHAKSSTLNFGLAAKYGGTCNLRFDDTNPETEEIEYVKAIKRDLRWLGLEWDDNEFYASDYFEKLYEWAQVLIRNGKAYVDDLSEAAVRAYRGTVTQPGRESPFRTRSPRENLDLFERMRRGEFADGARVLRAKIDMAHPNMKMRDPLMYRIRHATHYRQGDGWCIYPFYDWAHGQSDAIEGVTHSICTLEFAVNRPLYDWYLDALEISPRPYQYEFARLNLAYTVTSKRKLLQLVGEGHVDGWDDPRMPTLAGIRRRGITPQAIRSFCEAVGTTKVDSISDPSLLEHTVRHDLNDKAPRVLCVLRPLKVTLTNYPATKRETLNAPYWPHDIGREGSREVPFSGSLFIEKEDFSDDPPKGYRRLTPGATIRLRYAYVIRCDDVVRNADGDVEELLCTWFPETKSGTTTSGPKPRGTIHWVDASNSLPCEVRLYDRLFGAVLPGDGTSDFKDDLNSKSIEILSDCRIEPSVAADKTDSRYQFTRLGYFWQDPEVSRPESLVFNRIVALRDTWAKLTARTRRHDVPDVEPKSPTLRQRERKMPRLDSEAERWVERAVLTWKLSRQDAAVLATAEGAAAFFEEAAQIAKPNAVANWMVNTLLPARKGKPVHGSEVGPKDLAAVVALVDSGRITTRTGRAILGQMLESGGSPEQLAAERRREAITDPEALIPVVEDLLEAYPDKVQAYRDGKKGLLGFFVGQVMKATRGKARPQLVKELLHERL